jgi:hypothetical protein
MYSVTAPIMMLAPLWLYGVALIALRRLRAPAPAAKDLKEQLIAEQGADESDWAALRAAIPGHAEPPPEHAIELPVQTKPPLPTKLPGEYEVLDTRQFVWIAYVCFVAG